MKNYHTLAIVISSAAFLAALIGCGGNGAGAGLTSGTTGGNTGTTGTNGTTGTTGTSGYHIVALPATTPGAQVNDYVTGIDNAGDVVGSEQATGSSTVYAIEYSAATQKTIDLTPGSKSTAIGINASGLAIGDLTVTSSTSQAIFWKPGSTTYTTLPNMTGWVSSATMAVNDSGLVCGYGVTSTGTWVPAVWDTTTVGQPTVLQQLPGSGSCMPESINDAGQIVGQQSISASQTTALYWSSAAAKPIALAGQSGGGAGTYHIFDSGLIAGYDQSGSESVYWSSPTGTETSFTTQSLTWGGSNASDVGVGGVEEAFGKARPSLRPATGKESYPYMWSESAGFTNVNTLLDSTSKAQNWTLFLQAINSKGVMAGFGYMLGAKVYSAFVVEPPATTDRKF